MSAHSLQALPGRLRFIDHIRPNTPITNHQVPRIDPPLDPLQPLVILLSPEHTLPIRLVWIRFIDISPTVWADDLAQLQTDFDKLLLPSLLLCVGSVVWPVDAKAHNGAARGPDGVN